MHEFFFTATMIAILIAITVIDIRTQRIPNGLNISLAVLGIGLQATLGWQNLGIHLVAAAGLAGAMLLVREFHYRQRGHVGLGLGDVKMAGAAAFWISPWNLPLLLLCVSVAALAFLLLRSAMTVGMSSEGRIAFGPFIAFALISVWVIENGLLPKFELS